MGILPRRGGTDQPRATPWDRDVEPTSSPERARHGASDVSPFQGSGTDIRPDPRRCPGLICGCPFRATDNDAGIDATVSEDHLLALLQSGHPWARQYVSLPHGGASRPTVRL